MSRTFVGFGFGAIQGGLFLLEAHRSGNFDRLVVAEVFPDAVNAVRAAGGTYRVNVATRYGVERREIGGVDMRNPAVPEDRARLVAAVAEASELATALPSVRFYGGAAPADAAGILADGFRRKAERGGPRAVVYTAENDNRAAEILDAAILRLAPEARGCFQCLNTVIGKMSGVVTDREELARQKLAPIADGLDRAFLVEEFCRILVSKIELSDFERGIAVFEEKHNLLPFEEAKLYGHNATHALLGFLLRLRGRTYMADAMDECGLLGTAREAFVGEAGAALCRAHGGVDPLFTEEGFRSYADHLLDRMMNPWLRDTVERITRDARRKLGWNDRLVGTMRLALRQGIEPRRYAAGAAAALRVLRQEEKMPLTALLPTLWRTDDPCPEEARAVRDRILEADKTL